MPLQAAQTQAWGHSLAELPHLALLVAVVPVVAQTQQQLMLAVQEVFPAAVRAVEDRPSQAAQRQRAAQEGRAS